MICEGRTAIVTGAAGSGMGRSIALTLAREGARIVVNYRKSEPSATAIVNHVQSQGGQAIGVRADVFTADGCKAIVDAALQRFGRADICIVNPGGEWRPGPIENISPGDALEDVRRELAPLFHLMPLVLPGMCQRRWGRIIGLGLLSEDSVSPGHGYSYCVGKSARTEAIRMLRSQAWQHGVTANLVAPGPVSAIESLDEAIEQCNHGTAWVKRPNVSPQDIAEGVVFLCSEAGKFISGGVISYLYE
jgi:NAD(P)-dependent dehydrogenase (short-subunit alcohol dehydrogenase family)